MPGDDRIALALAVDLALVWHAVRMCSRSPRHAIPSARSHHRYRRDRDDRRLLLDGMHGTIHLDRADTHAAA